MPWIEDNDFQFIERDLVNSPKLEGASPDFIELTKAMFRTENTIGSLISQEKGLPDKYIENPDFNPWNELTEEEKLDESFIKNAMLSDNLDELQAVRMQTQKEREDRELISEGGATSFLLGFTAGVLDPINLMPVGGVAYKTYRTGSSLLKAGLATGSVAAGTTAATEAALHKTQLERTYGESAVNVTGAMLLGGVLGVGAAKLSSYGVTDDVFKQIEYAFEHESKVRNGIDSVGAARAATDVEIKGGKAIKGLIKFTGFDPVSKLMLSEAPASRAAVNKLAENVYDVDGTPTTAVETFIKLHDGKYIAAYQSHLKLYSEMQMELGGKTGVGRIVNRKGMSRQSFNDLVSKQIRNPSDDAIPQVKKAADIWARELYEPLKNEAIAAKLLPEDVEVSTAINYLNRIWNKQKINANPAEFERVVANWLEEEDAKLFSQFDSLSSELKTAKGARKTEIESQLKKIEFKEKLETTREEYEDIARQIKQRITATPDGRLPYDWKLGEGSKSFATAGTKLKSPLRARTFQIPDKLIEQFLENDIEVLGARYLRQMTPDIELSKAFDGDLDLTAERGAIAEFYSKKAKEAKTEKERINIAKQSEKDIANLVAIKDRIRGTYGQVDHDALWVRSLRVARDLNYLRFMGGVLPSSVPDVARIFMAEGFGKAFKFGLKPLATNLKGFKVAAEEAKLWGIGVEALTNRADVLADIADYTQGKTAFERGVHSAAQQFSSINLMNQWTTSVKQLHAVTMQSSILESLSKGKIDKRLRRLGISDEDALNIWQEVKKHGKKVDDVWISGAKNWDSPQLERMWGGAIRKESDRVIVTPGQEKPLFMSREMGKTIMQFRSFMFSSTQRMLIAGLQGQDHNFIGGFAALTTLGMMSYAFKQWDAGREISDDPITLITEGIDRSGSLGMIMEINNTMEKITNNNYGLRPMLGVTAPAARFASRNQTEAFLGPTFGSLATTTLRVASAGADDNEWTDADTRALRRLLPYQNLFLFRQLVDKLEESVK